MQDQDLTQPSRVCACGCGRSLAGMRSNRRYRYTTCKRRPPKEPEAGTLLAIMQFDPCSYCGARGEFWRSTLGVDHIVAMSQGGPDDTTNLTASCRGCNSSKCDRDLLGYLLYRRSTGRTYGS